MEQNKNLQKENNGIRNYCVKLNLKIDGLENDCNCDCDYLKSYEQENNKLNERIKTAIKFLQDLLPFMYCLTLDDEIAKAFNFERISKSIIEAISTLKGEGK